MKILNKSLKKALTLSLVLGLSANLLVGCGKKESATIDENSLYSYKTEFVGDNSKVISIVSKLDYNNFDYDSILIQSEKEPYGLTVYLNGEENKEHDFFDNAIMTFALIENLENIKYVDKNTENILEEFNRMDTNTILRENGQKEINQIGENEEEFNKYTEEVSK